MAASYKKPRPDAGLEGNLQIHGSGPAHWSANREAGGGEGFQSVCVCVCVSAEAEYWTSELSSFGGLGLGIFS